MKYTDGTDARLGDHVQVINGDSGVIVASMDTNEYSSEYEITFAYDQPPHCDADENRQNRNDDVSRLRSMPLNYTGLA